MSKAYSIVAAELGVSRQSLYQRIRIGTVQAKPMQVSPSKRTWLIPDHEVERLKKEKEAKSRGKHS